MQEKSDLFVLRRNEVVNSIGAKAVKRKRSEHKRFMMDDSNGFERKESNGLFLRLPFRNTIASKVRKRE